MRYYRCKCGKRAAWSSMGHQACDGCDACNTTLEEHPDYHRTPPPHDWETEWCIDAKTGERWQERVCQFCHKREKVASPVPPVGPPNHSIVEGEQPT